MFNLPNEQAKARFQEAFLRLELSFEKPLAHGIHGTLDQLAQRISSIYEKEGLQAALFAVSELEAPLQRHFIVHLTRTFTRFADETAGTVDPVLTGANQHLVAAQRYVRTQGATKIKHITLTTRQQLQRVIEEGIVDGHSVAHIQRRIRETTGGQMGRHRARRIAQTEVHSAACAGSHSAIESLNRPYQKEWVASLQPGRTRPWHLSAHGQIVSSEDSFLVDGEYLRHPGDPAGSARNVVNCRCVAAYRL